MFRHISCENCARVEGRRRSRQGLFDLLGKDYGKKQCGEPACREKAHCAKICERTHIARRGIARRLARACLPRAGVS